MITSAAPARAYCPRSKSGLSLVEVMVATVIVTFIGASLVGAFIQNARLARALMLRTAATTTAIGVSEQLRSFSYSDLLARHTAPSTAVFPIRIFDPTATTVDAGMTQVDMAVNVVDGVAVTGTIPTSVIVPVVLEDSGTSTRANVPMRFWLQIRKRTPRTKTTTETDPATGKTTTKSEIVDRCEVFELALVYQWRNSSETSGKWQSSVLRVVTPNNNMNADSGASS